MAPWRLRCLAGIGGDRGLLSRRDCGGRAEDLAAFAAGRSALPWLLPELDDSRTVNLQNPTLEPFYAFVHFCDPAHSITCKELIRRTVRFPSHIEQAGERIASLLGDFAAVHVRRSDFLGQRPEQDLAAAQIAQALSNAGVRSRMLYIASDDKDHSFFAPLASNHEIVFADDFLDYALRGAR